MSNIQVQLRRGTTAQHSTFTGAEGELTFDTTRKTLIVHDGITAGGRSPVNESYVTPKDFGAVGDGTTDDTAAVQAALSSTSKKVYIGPGTYRIVAPDSSGDPVLTSSVADRIISGPGILTATAQVKHLIKVTGNNNQISVNIDGNSYIGYGLTVAAENFAITDCHIYDLDGLTTYGGVAIRADLDGLDTSGLIANNVIRNIQGAGDGIGGNGIGMQRAISINSDQNCTKRILVTNNVIDQIEGEEGDAIIVISSDGASTYYDMPVAITNNTINLWTRRAIKVQANKVTISGNVFTNDRGSDPGGLQRVVDIVQGSDNTITNNIFRACKYQSQIACYLDVSETVDNITISGNLIEGLSTETTSVAIVTKYVDDGVVITNNTINCPTFATTFVQIENASNVVIAGNVIDINTTTWYSFTSATGVRMTGNVSGNAQSVAYQNYVDYDAGEFLFDVSSGRSVTLLQRDSTLSSGEEIAALKCRQNDASYPNGVHSSIRWTAVGTSGSTQLELSTGSGTAPDVSKVVVETGGNFRPYVDNTYDLGTASYRWAEVFAGTGTINTSDQNEKQQVRTLNDTEKAVATELKGLVKAFKWNNAVASKGDNARIHIGLIAQEVEAAFAAHGLNGAEYGILCRDIWWTNADGQIEVDDAGAVVTEPVDTTGLTKNERMGLRYDQLLAFIISTL